MSVEVEKARSILMNSHLPMKQRMRALFYLRNINSAESIDAIILAFSDKSVLLKHEAAYVLGQIQNETSINFLIDVLSNESEDEIVRHEAAEALGNFLPHSETLFVNILEILQKFSTHACKPIQETCYIALKKAQELQELKKADKHFQIEPSPYQSYDPAFPLTNCTLEHAVDIFLKSKCMYERYKAMFYLRNLNNKEAVGYLSQGFNDGSDLFKHEVAFVFGQMRNEHSIDSLHEVLKNTNEHGMVRHEAAEALGAIGSDLSIPVLKQFLNDPVDVVRESVEVALDIHEYENGLQEEYATV